MKHMIKVIIFFIFILTVLYFGIQQTNSHNFDIIQQYVSEDTKEVISTSTEKQDFVIKFFGEEVVIDKNTLKSVRDMISNIKNR